MSGKRFWIAVLCSVVIILAVSAAAQDEKNEIGGIIGRTFISDQGIKCDLLRSHHPFRQRPELRRRVRAPFHGNADLRPLRGRPFMYNHEWI